MAKTAEAFLASLAPEQRATVIRPFDDGAARTNWNYLPSSMATRDGLALGNLDAGQRRAAHALFAAALSSQGYGKAAQIMWLDDVLHDIQEADLKASTDTGAALERRQRLVNSRDSGQYWIVVFGKPGAPDWGWMLSGHHYAVNFTVVGGQVAFTPLFLGANPQMIETGRYAGWRTLQHGIDRAADLVSSLTADQRAMAQVSATVPAAMFADKGRKDDSIAMTGLPASRMDDAQQAMLMGLVREYIGDAADEPAAEQMAAISKDGMKALHFAWWGPVDDTSQRFMYRVHGPSILIEFVREALADGSAANHVHSIVRNPRNDYGEDWLKRHYQEQHQP